MNISVYITSYNQKAYLIEAIESVLNQTLRPFEIIIVDDCSTDGSQDVIERYFHEYPELVRPFYQSVNQGIPINKSFAFEQVRGDLVTYLDGDDRFLPRKLEFEYNTILNHPDVRIVYSNIFYIDNNGRRIGQWTDNKIPPPTGYVFREVFGREFPRGSVFRNELIDYKSLKSVGFYDSNFAMYHDWELRVRLTKHFKVAFCSEPLAEYRKHPDGISRSVPSKHLDEIRRVYHKNKPLLDDISVEDCKAIRRKLFILMGKIASRAADDALKGEQNQKASRARALKFYFKSLKYNPHNINYKVMLKYILPRRAYGLMRSIYHVF